MIDLKLDHVSKKYNIPASSNSPKRWYKRGFARRSSEMWALRDISFEVKEGGALGIVGHNGAGKTTLLKLLSSITAPTRGQITIRGRLAALVEVSSGFHQGCRETVPECVCADRFLDPCAYKLVRRIRLRVRGLQCPRPP